MMKNRYVGRTFIQPNQALRQRGVRMKLSVVRRAVEGKRVVLVDDSIVRGITSGRIVSMLKDNGATEVHMRVTSPPIKHPCLYGIDTARRMELIAAIKGIEATAVGSAISLHSDSTYLVNTMTKGWKRNANTDLWDQLDQLTSSRNVNFEWVKAHAGHPRNEEVDRLAVAAMRSIGSVDANSGCTPIQQGGLTHLDTKGNAHMVDVGDKPDSDRNATASSDSPASGRGSGFGSGASATTATASAPARAHDPAIARPKPAPPPVMPAPLPSSRPLT